MVRGTVSSSFSLDSVPFYTDGTPIHGLLTFDVRKHDAAVGTLTARLLCEERIGTVQNCSIVSTHQLDNIPPVLSRGVQNYELSLAVGSQSLANFPPSIPTDTRHDSVGVYWILEVRGDQPASLYASQIVHVYPARALPIQDDDAAVNGYRKVHRRVPMIASLVAGEPHKQRPKLFVMLFGPSYRTPKDGELCEVFVRLGISIPEVGVFQSPSKSQLGASISTAADEAVVLSMCFVKLVSTTSIKGTDKTFTTTTDVWEKEMEIVLPRGNFSLNSEIADIELPPCSGTTESSLLTQQYEIKFIFVLRALHFSNLTRWVTLSAPITVLPASISRSDLGESPPPYAG